MGVNNKGNDRDLITFCHLTTAHPADDPRIYRRECLSLAEFNLGKVTLVAHGNLNHENIEFISLGKIPENRINRFVSAQFKSLKLLFKLNPSIWHIHDLELVPFGILLTLFRKQVIWDAHEDYYHQFKPEISYRTYIPIFLRNFLKNFVYLILTVLDKRAVAVVAATEEIAKKYGNKNTIIVGNETSVEQFEKCVPNFEARVAIFTGNMSDQQCFRKIIIAMSEISDINLFVAGRRNEIEIEFATKLLGERFKHLGWLGPEELVEVFSKSSFGFVTYEDSPLFTSNRSNKFYEFSAAGLPILATPTGANLELLESSRGGLTSDDFSETSLRTAIVKILSNENNWKVMSQNSKVWAHENGNWESSKKRLLNLYSKLIDN